MENNLLEVKNLRKIYHNETGEILALKDVSFNVKKKEHKTIN